jgi:hypothetical protein
MPNPDRRRIRCEQPGSHDTHPINDDHLQNRARTGTERNPDADLWNSLRDGMRHESEQPDEKSSTATAPKPLDSSAPIPSWARASVRCHSEN